MPLPTRACPGRIVIAKPLDPTSRRSMRCHYGELGRPSVGPSGACISSHRTRVRKASHRFVSLNACSTEETNQRLRQSSANVPSSNQWIITQPTLRLLTTPPLRAFCLAQTLAVRPQAAKHMRVLGGFGAPVGSAQAVCPTRARRLKAASVATLPCSGPARRYGRRGRA